MSRIPRETIDEIRARVDIAAVVERYVQLQRKGTRYVGLCPFHQERTPSFGVLPDKGIFHCFGCQAGGDAFKFLMMIEGLSFLEAAKELANVAGIDIPDREMTDDERQAMRQRASRYDVLEAAAEYFRSNLWSRPEGAPGRDYVATRGLSEEVAKAAGLGFAPDAWTSLGDWLHRRHYPEELARDVGLVKPSNRGDGSYDTFRNRLVFPIRDERGRVVGFGGRLVSGEGPKYLNSPETVVYDKSKVLYGLYEARQAISRAGRVLLVEGYMDVLALRQAGFGEAIASCGTALTSHHMEKIRRLCSNAVALFDSDDAGVRAAERSLPLFLDAGVQPWRLDLGDAKDPDELVQKHGPEAMEQALSRPVPLFEWVVGRKVDHPTFSVAGAGTLLDELIPLLKRLPPTVRGWTAQRLRIPEAALIERLNAAPQRAEEAPPPPPVAGWRADRDVVHLLWLLVHRRNEVADLVQRVPDDVLAEHPPVVPVVARLLSGEDVAAILQEIPDVGVQRALGAIVARDALYDVGKGALGAVQVIERLSRKRRRDRIEALATDSQRALDAQDLPRYRLAAEERRRLKESEERLLAALRAEDVARAADELDSVLHNSSR
jgi:DNA primase